MNGERPEVTDTINYGIGTEVVDSYESTITDRSCPVETGGKLIDDAGDQFGSGFMMKQGKTLNNLTLKSI